MKIHEIQNHLLALNPQWLTQDRIYREIVSSEVNSETIILDIGCGRSNAMCEIYSRAKKVIGQDIDEVAIAQHPCLDERIIGDFDELGRLGNGTINVITCSWVFEHLENPDKLFEQAKRLLAPNGVFIALTPNKNSLVTILSRLIPNSLHRKIVKLLWGRAEEDTYPTFYKLNSPKQIKKYCEKYSLVIEEIRELRDPSYYISDPELANWIFKMHQKLIPKWMCEGFIIKLRNNA